MIRRRGAAVALAALALGGVGVIAALRPTSDEPCAIRRPTFEANTETALLVRQRGADFWTGRQITATQSQIDHVLPWCWALRHGLDEGDRVGFYRDRDNLVAAAGPVNAAKSDQPPWGSWRPVLAGRHCDQARIFDATAVRWRLRFNASERSNLNQILKECGP